MRIAAVMIFVFFAGAAACCAQTISSTELIAQAKNFDNKTVTYTGEVIGEVMKRGNSAWVNVNDGRNAIGIWITAEMAAEIGRAGNFKNTGDTIEVVGLFNRVCLQHGGDLDIHAQAMRVTTPGFLNKSCSLNKVKKDWVIKLLGVVAIVWILSLLKMR